MSKAIQSMDTAITSAPALRNGAGKCAGQNESGGFSRLLSAGQAEHADREEARAVPESGKNLPGEQRRVRAGDGTEKQAETPATPATPADLAQTPEGRQADTVSPGEQALSGVPALPVEQNDAATTGTAEGDDPATEDGRASGQSAIPGGPAAGMPGLQAVPVEVPLTAGGADAADAAAAVAVASARPAAPPAADLVPGGSEQPDAVRNRPATDPVGHAVREGVMHMLASRAGQGGGGDALAGGDGEQPATFQPPPAAARSAAAGILSFTDALLETGTTTPSSRVAIPVGQPGWGRAVGEQVVWYVSQNIQSASLKLNPQHLGPLELQLHMDGDKASIAFTSQHAAVRDALESSLSRLRDMLAEQGLNLVNVNVSQHEAGSRREQAADGNRAGASLRMANGEERLPLAGGVPGMVAARGLVDYYV